MEEFYAPDVQAVFNTFAEEGFVVVKKMTPEESEGVGSCKIS
jgi:hypothetical protein